MLLILVCLVVLAAISIVTMRVAFPLPDNADRVSSSAIPLSEETTLGSRLMAMSDQHPDLSGIVPLADGRDAFAARVLLARAAEASIDVQYYIWQRDTTGWILLDELRAAAERGVRVRLLLDDNGIPGLDGELAGLNALPTAEVRLFNPFTLRSPRLASYLFDFRRLNRRMHNKSMTVDGAVSIVGGRNIGDIYFAYGDGAHYFDFDVLAAGTAANDVSSDFDRYWSSASAHAASAILPRAPDGLSSLREAAERARQSAKGSGYVEALQASSLISDLLSDALSLEWTNATLVSDDPSKGLGTAGQSELLVGKLPDILGAPQESVDLVSAYFIPGQQGLDLLSGFASRGVATRVLTNSLEATDVAPVHSAYMRYRPRLLDAGVRLLELRARPSTQPESLVEHMLSGSTASLHAKTFAIDGEKVFIGSFNFDPRSAALNTEMGFLIDSPTIARNLSMALDRPTASYDVRRTSSGHLEWRQMDVQGAELVYDTEPNTTLLRRAVVRLMSWLPVEWML